MRKALPGYIGLFCAIIFSADILWAESTQIASLQEELEGMESKQEQLELEKRMLVSEGEPLVERIEKLKSEAQRGIGILDEYKLKKDLRKSRELAQKIEALEVHVEASKKAIAEKKSALMSLYEAEISLVLEKLDERSKEEAQHLLERLKALRAAKERLKRTEEPVKVEDLRVEEIHVEEEDDAERIREKADLISDFVGKLAGKLGLIDQRIKELEKERKNEEKIREFVQELSLFDEDRLTSRHLQVQPTEVFGAEVSAERTPDLSVAGWESSTDEMEREMEALRKEREKVARKSSDLSRKAEAFYRKAAERSKSKGATGEP